MNTEFEKFYAQAWNMGNTTMITIPHNLVKGAGYEAGDKFKVMIKLIESIK